MANEMKNVEDNEQMSNSEASVAMWRREIIDRMEEENERAREREKPKLKLKWNEQCEMVLSVCTWKKKRRFVSLFILFSLRMMSGK